MGLIILIFLISCISPVIGGIMALMSLKFFFNSRKIYILFFLIAGILGFLNSLKLPESDLINYVMYFNNASILGYTDYLLNENKEYIFFTLTFILNWLLFGNFDFYLIVITSFCYGTILICIYNLCKFWRLDFESFFLALICCVFFPNLFSVSAHLLRQFIAAAIICVYVIELIKGKKLGGLLMLLIIATFIHSSSLFFVYLLFFKFKNYIFKEYILRLALVSLCFVLISYFENELINLPGLGYAFQRFFNIGEVSSHVDNLNFLQIFIQIITIIISFLYFLRYKKNKNSIIIFTWIFILTIFIMNNYNNQEIALRFSFYIYFIFPFIFLFIYSLFKVDKFVRISLNFIFIFIFIYWFIYKINNGTWQYLNLEKMFLTI